MQKNKELELLKNSCVEQNGFNQLSWEKLQENGLLPKPKDNDDYLNEFSEELSSHPSNLTYPLVCSFVTKMSETYEKVTTFVALTAVELESKIAYHYMPHISIYSKLSLNNYEAEEYNKLIDFFEAGHNFVAQVVIDDHEFLLPVEENTSFSEIALSAAKKLPGHGIILKNGQDAYDFYEANYKRFVLPKRKELLDAIDELTFFQDENYSLFYLILSENLAEEW
ncbi:MAG: hypothetical protein HWE10_02880 [Gammaproteobacteria bacterium]|nr:hypothetical protein [Gammaproteobacteria bacterium]